MFETETVGSYLVQKLKWEGVGAITDCQHDSENEKHLENSLK